MEGAVCVLNNFRGLGDDGEPIGECRMQLVSELRERRGWLYEEVWPHDEGQDVWDGFIEMVDKVLESDEWDAYYLWGNWTIEASRCRSNGECVGCPYHWAGLSDESEGTMSDGSVIGDEIERRNAYERETGSSWASRGGDEVVS